MAKPHIARYFAEEVRGTEIIQTNVLGFSGVAINRSDWKNVALGFYKREKTELLPKCPVERIVEICLRKQLFCFWRAVHKPNGRGRKHLPVSQQRVDRRVLAREIRVDCRVEMFKVKLANLFQFDKQLILVMSACPATVLPSNAFSSASAPSAPALNIFGGQNWHQKAQLVVLTSLPWFAGSSPVGERRCPNLNCRALICVAWQNNQLVRSYPALRIDFDKTNIPGAIVTTLEEATIPRLGLTLSSVSSKSRSA